MRSNAQPDCGSPAIVVQEAPAGKRAGGRRVTGKPPRMDGAPAGERTARCRRPLLRGLQRVLRASRSSSAGLCRAAPPCAAEGAHSGGSEGEAHLQLDLQGSTAGGGGSTGGNREEGGGEKKLAAGGRGKCAWGQRCAAHMGKRKGVMVEPTHVGCHREIGTERSPLISALKRRSSSAVIRMTSS